VRVLGMPNAGAGCAAFADCAAAVTSDIAVYGLNLPGRQARFAERARTDLGPLLDEIVADLRTYTDRPYVLFGYCSGALLAYLTAQRARAAGVAAPQALVVVSYCAPHLAVPAADLHTLPSAPFWTQIIANGGVSEQLTAQPGFQEVFEPALRADYEMLAGFRHTRTQPLDVPVIAVAGDRDPLLRREDVTAWADHTTGRFDLRLLPGDHWLFATAVTELAGILESACHR
jgi:surfactin synthase thioesterase subunit